jgi:uncharacterized protein (DUF2249 family)/uncharacterized protein YjiS (DUF1127 family)
MNKALTFKAAERRALNRALNWFARELNALGKGIFKARRMHRAYRELAAMSDHDLEDIGVSRSDLPRIFAGTYHRERSATQNNVSPIAGKERSRLPGSKIEVATARSRQMTDLARTAGAEVVDVRSLIPAQRHAKIFELVGALGPGASFILVNDHDPKPLYYQLEAECPKQFSWRYLERGPDVWRVQIEKLAQAA